MPRSAWLLMVAVAAAAALATWFAAGGGRSSDAPAADDPVRAEEFRLLRAENEGLRRRPEDALAAAIDVLVAADVDQGLELLGWLRTSRTEQDRRVAFAVLASARDVALAPLLREAIENPDRPEDLAQLQQAAARLKGHGWSPRQATGEPDTHQAGDLRTAWASKQGDMGAVWLELDYADAVRVHETYNPGAIARIEAKRADGSGYDVLWEGTATGAEAPHWFAPALGGASGATRTIRIVLDTDRVKGWNEIDAVELVGGGLRHWAIAARASSSYGAP